MHMFRKMSNTFLTGFFFEHFVALKYHTQFKGVMEDWDEISFADISVQYETLSYCQVVTVCFTVI